MVILDYRKNVRSVRVYHINKIKTNHAKNRSSPPEGLLGKGVLNRYSKFTGENTQAKV